MPAVIGMRAVPGMGIISCMCIMRRMINIVSMRGFIHYLMLHRFMVLVRRVLRRSVIHRLMACVMPMMVVVS
jgi:membrane protein required for beta-lactamase induction